MPNPSKAKGDRLEREVVKALHDLGYEVQRVPLSGAVGGIYSGDINISGKRIDPCGGPNITIKRNEQFKRDFGFDWPFTIDPLEMHLECKSRKNGEGFKTLYNWLDGKDGLVLKADRKERLYVLPESTLKALIG